MKQKLLLPLATLLLLTVCAQVNAQRIAGYIQSTTYSNPPGPGTALTMSQIQFNQCTDIIFCFINPDASNTGALQLDIAGAADFDFEMDKFQDVKGRCYPMVDNGPRLWIAVGGASSAGISGPRPTRLNTVCNAAGTRTTFATNLVNFAIKHELAGIDVDWEFPVSAGEVANFSAFVLALRTAINASTNVKLKISVTVGGETVAGGCVAVGSGTNHMAYFPSSPGNAAMLAAVDYFHVMAYDLPASFGNNHSLPSDGNTSMTNWNTCRAIPKTKMCIGIPFYGKDPARSTITNYFNLGAGAFGTDGPTATVYYNGTPAIGAKIDAIRSNTYNGAGVIIWDIAQDQSGATSLLAYANTRMFGNTNVTNPCSTIPYLGKDTTMCTGSTLTLNSGVSLTGGSPTRTFSWVKNGSAFGGASNTQAITTAGTYSVIVTQQANPVGTTTPCILKDTIVVTEVAPVTVPTATPTTVCATTTATSTLATTATSGTIEWYTTANGGAPFATGTSTPVTPAVTTTYYAQTSGLPANKTLYGGRGYADLPATLQIERTAHVGMTTRPEWANFLTVIQPITIKSVVAYFSAQVTHNPVSIMILDATQPIGNAPVFQSAGVTVAAHTNAEAWTGYATILTVNATLQPGTYWVGLYNPNGSVAPQYVLNQTALSYPSGAANIYSIAGTVSLNNGATYGANTGYGQLFDWRITSAALTQCARQSVVVTYNCPAPVSLTSFTGNNHDQQNNLSWSTASEVNNDHFDVERSEDGINFSVIGSVSGNGSTNTTSNYSLIDRTFTGEKEYYRLAQYDYNGKVTYSNTIELTNGVVISCLAVPNPFDQFATIQIRNIENALVTVYDVQGNIVYTKQLTDSSADLNIGSGLLPGIYFVQVNGSNFYNKLKIVKQ